MTEKKAPEMPWPFVRRCAECFPTDFYAYYQGRNYCEFGHEKFSTGYWIQEAEARKLLDMRAERDRLREALKYRTSACLAFDRMLQWDWFQQALLYAPRDIIEQIEFAREQSNIADQALDRIADVLSAPQASPAIEEILK